MSSAVRISVVMVVGAAGAFAVLGFGLALLFEVDGFGVPRDVPPRSGYLFVYGAGALLGVVVPAAVAWLLLRGGRRWVLAVAAVLTTAVTVALLGTTA